MDHLERARREEEAPLLEAAYQARLADDKAFHEQQQQQQAEAHKLAWEVDIQEKQRWAAGWSACNGSGHLLQRGAGTAEECLTVLYSMGYCCCCC
jgi:hypothetical protein